MVESVMIYEILNQRFDVFFFGQENILFVCFGLKLNHNPTLPNVWGTNDGVVGGLEGGGGAWK